MASAVWQLMREGLAQVDSKTQTYLDDFIKRKKEMLAAAKNVTLTAANLEEVGIKQGETEDMFEKNEQVTLDRLRGVSCSQRPARTCPTCSRGRGDGVADHGCVVWRGRGDRMRIMR